MRDFDCFKFARRCHPLAYVTVVIVSLALLAWEIFTRTKRRKTVILHLCLRHIVKQAPLRRLFLLKKAALLLGAKTNRPICISIKRLFSERANSLSSLGQWAVEKAHC